MNKKEDKYFWNFKGANLTKRETKIVGLTLLFGWIGAVLAILAPFEKSRLADIGIISIIAIVGYAIARKTVK